MNHLRNICSTQRIKYISNHDGEIIFDIGQKDEQAMEEIRKTLGSNLESSMTEVFTVPNSLKEEFYRVLQAMGHMKRSQSGH